MAILLSTKKHLWPEQATRGFLYVKVHLYLPTYIAKDIIISLVCNDFVKTKLSVFNLFLALGNKNGLKLSLYNTNNTLKPQYQSFLKIICNYK